MKLTATCDIKTYKDKILIGKGNKYIIYSTFEEEKFENGIGYVVFCENNSFEGFDSKYFKTNKEIDMINKKNKYKI